MTPTSLTLLVIAALAAIADWSAVASRNKRLEVYAKPAATAALVLAAQFLAGGPSERRSWFIAALVLSLLGDVFLMLEPEEFIAGLVAFLLAHLAYIAGFAVGPDLSALPVWLGIAIAAAFAATVGSVVIARSPPSLKVPVALYMTVICAMVVAAIAAGPLLAVVGAMLFLASDSILGWRKFVQEQPWMPVAVMTTYHAAQALLVLSLLGL